MHTVNDMMTAYNVSRTAVIRWINQGLLPGTQKHGRDYIIPDSAIKTFQRPIRGRKWERWANVKPD